MIYKKGQLGDMLMFFIFFLFMIIIGGGIVIGTFIFIGPETDFRSTEAAILNYKIRNCFLDGKLNDWESYKAEKVDLRVAFISKRCGLNKDIIGTYDFVKVCEFKNNEKDCITNDDPLLSTGGDFNPCGLTEKNKFAGCSMTRTIKDGKDYTFITLSKQNIRRSVA